jgi:2-amino-4-hydroxy-6-hydroxymethyldihydropteridine diphosphokinase
MKKVFLSFGSSLGTRIENFHQALARLKKFGNVAETSFLYKTDPMYNTDQDFYLNAVILFETNKSPFELLKNLQDIENVE